MNAGRVMSLRRQLIVRMLSLMLPLFVLLWVVAHFSSQHFINAAFDRSLMRRAYALADQIEVVQGRVRVDLPAAAREVLVFDQEDLLFHRILDPQRRVIEGERYMPPLPGARRLKPGQMIVYDGTKDGEPVRVAAFALSLGGTSARGEALIQVGETLARRTALADRATLAIVIPMLLMALSAAAAIAYGVGRGLEPVARLRNRLAARPAFDLGPMPLDGAPAELLPFLDEINSLLRRLSEAVDAQSRFVSDAAHQLRTPIAGIRAQAEAALTSARPEDAQHALARIAQSAQELGALVQKLLLLARVDAAENTLQTLRLDSAELVKSVAREWAPDALAKGCDIGFEAGGGDAWVMGDAQLLRELLANLIDNALRYGGTRVTLAVRAVAGSVVWEIADDGPGIPEAQRAAVFLPFMRLSVSAGGAGLGLTIAQRIAKLHGATVDLLAGPDGHGLTVRVTFPPVSR